MSIGQITTGNTFGQLVTAVSAMIAVANNLTDGPQVHSNSSWTFTNPGVGINVGNTAIMNTANLIVLNAGFANVISGNLVTVNVGTANVVVANLGGATVIALNASSANMSNANVQGTFQVSGWANIATANISTLNTGTLSISTLTVTGTEITPHLDCSFANITSGLVGVWQATQVIATLTTVTNANSVLLNSSTANITSLNVTSCNLNTAYIYALTVGTTNPNTALINVASINTASIISCNITGRINVASDPTWRLEVSTKGYTDNTVNSHSAAALVTTKGDILVADVASNLVRFGLGTNGQSLIVDTTQSLGVRYASRGLSQSFRGLSLGTSQKDQVANGTQVVIYRLDEAVMDDGEVVTGWTLPATVDITASGVGGLDGGSSNTNTWYELHAIRKRTDGTKGFMFHRALDRNPDQNTMNTVQWAQNAHQAVNTITTPYPYVAQSFVANTSGPLTSIEIRLYKQGSTVTGNCWLTFEANTAGNASGIALATSRKMDVARLQQTNQYPVRFVFDTTANTVAGTSYFWVLRTDYAASDTSWINLEGSSSGPIYYNGVPKGNNGTSWVALNPTINVFPFKTYSEANSVAITYPAGYDQHCLISYVSVDSNSKLREFRQRDRTMNMFYSPQWMGYQLDTSTYQQVADLTLTIPPVQCEAIFLVYNGSGGINFLALGSLDAIDLPASGAVTTTRGYVMGHSTSSGSQAVGHNPPMWIEQQACNFRNGGTIANVYTQVITF
jgi:uncharacterized protein YjbI with pentapeptide repeats